MRRDLVFAALLVFATACGVEQGAAGEDPTGELGAALTIGKLSPGMKFEQSGEWVRRVLLNEVEHQAGAAPEYGEEVVGKGDFTLLVKTMKESKSVVEGVATVDVRFTDPDGTPHEINDTTILFSAYQVVWRGNADTAAGHNLKFNFSIYSPLWGVSLDEGESTLQLRTR